MKEKDEEDKSTTDLCYACINLICSASSQEWQHTSLHAQPDICWTSAER